MQRLTRLHVEQLTRAGFDVDTLGPGLAMTRGRDAGVDRRVRRRAGRRRGVGGRRRLARRRRPGHATPPAAGHRVAAGRAVGRRRRGGGGGGRGVDGLAGAGVVAAAVAAMVPLLVGVRDRRAEQLARTEALAAWAEMLRDTIVGRRRPAGGGGGDGRRWRRRRSAPRCRRLAVRADRDTLAGAFRRFAADVADPVADLIVAALVIAEERQAQQLTQLLAGIARAAREQAAMRIRVETGRARTYASSRALVVITLGLAAGLIVFSPEFMEPYDTVAGQLVLLVIGALFAGALWGLVVLGRPAVPPRLLAGIGEDGADGGGRR